MSKLASSFVKLGKQKSIPALVTDVVGQYCSVILSGRGKTLRGIPYVGKPPMVGEAVYVNYTTGKPVVETTSSAAVDTPVAPTSQGNPTPTEHPIIGHHNDLGGLQGGLPTSVGVPAEYYHLTAEEHANLGGVVAGQPHIDQKGAANSTYGALVGDIDGNNDEFTVSEGVYTSGSLLVYLNGQLQSQGSDADWQEETPASGTLLFTDPPEIGDRIIVIYY